jgi:hypothetical protein
MWYQLKSDNISENCGTNNVRRPKPLPTMRSYYGRMELKCLDPHKGE